ncbi:hypothetical protein PYW08_015556 [Mythimna loreyi]|uniref:Uncharacterized protein n=1 Tax=Mythimna loreyi TaxID=667449 RepID=A0ACC2QWK7_9NEOP|nr:hypothetical protein PYW08_015556 [Mythimna loreyi]
MAFMRFVGKTCGFLGYALQTACVTHCAFEYVGDFVMCSGPSMEPTLQTNNVLFTEHISPRVQRLRRGDIVISRSPSNPKQNICKRITGLPGDRVRDSRLYGPVPEGLIRSRVVCRVWPLDKITLLSEY